MRTNGENMKAAFTQQPCRTEKSWIPTEVKRGKGAREPGVPARPWRRRQWAEHRQARTGATVEGSQGEGHTYAYNAAAWGAAAADRKRWCLKAPGVKEVVE